MPRATLQLAPFSVTRSVVLVCHFGGVLRYFGVVVNTPRKLHFAGPTNRDYPTVVDPSTDLGLAPPGLVLADGPL